MTSKEYMREYQRKWIAERRADYFKDKACVICGSTESLELDHVDPKKKVSSSIWSWSAQRRTVELAKCQVLCSIHHKEKTAREKHHGEQVGTSKLTEQQAREIKASPLKPYRLIAKQYGVDVSLVGYIKRGKVWKHLGK